MTKSFTDMSRTARRDAPPVFDVSAQVIYRLEVMEDEPIDKPLAWLTVGSFAAAAAMGMFSFSLYSTLADPMGILFQLTPMLGN